MGSKSNFILAVLLGMGSVAAFGGEAGSTTPARNPKAYPGYTLITSMNASAAYLIDMDGKTVHTWQTNNNPALSTYFLENGNLLRTGTRGGAGARLGERAGAGRAGGGARMGAGGAGGGGFAPGAGGRIQQIAWDGSLEWDLFYVLEKQLPHHDVTLLPNGNLLALVWDYKSAEESIAAGRNPEYQRTGGDLPPDGILEIQPDGKSGGKIVWEWHVWDHLIQDFDKDKPNYGAVADHPELIDLNYSESWMDPQPAGGRRGGGMGMGMGGGVGGRIATTDWTHFNAVAYNPDRDEITVSSYTFSEFWVIDHSTTTAQAASHQGGKRGKGGDLLYRWGNPEAYRAGKGEDQKLFCPHNAQWVAKGLPGAGNFLIFNNGPNRPNNERFSEVFEFVLPVDKDGNYQRNGAKFADPQTVWTYSAPNKTDFYAMNISGLQRLPNGNTLICSGPSGHLFEVTPAKEIVWTFDVPNPNAARGGGGGGMGMGGFGIQVFRAYRFGPDYPGLKGKDLPRP